MKKRSTLFPKHEEENLSVNVFLKEKYKEEHTILSCNGSTKLDTTGNSLVDDFASLSRYKYPRDPEEVFADCEHLWSLDSLLFLKETFYLRLITRKPILDGKRLGNHRGQGLKAEFATRLWWLATHHLTTFNRNLSIVPAVGSYNDLFNVLRLDLEYNGRPTFDWSYVFEFLKKSLENSETSSLVKKYLPTVATSSKCKTIHKEANAVIGRYFATFLFGHNPHKMALYRKCKSSGNAHEWQKLISQSRFDEIDFNKIAGRALANLTRVRTLNTYVENGYLVKRAGDNTNFIERHGLEDKFVEWLSKQDTAKFTGYPYELFKDVTPKSRYYQKDLINKQFLSLINKEDVSTDSNFIVCLDISGSMTAKASGTTMSSYEIGKAMALYFSYFLEGKFANTFLTFSDYVQIEQFKGNTPVDKYLNYNRSFYGSTNFLGVAKAFVRLRNAGYEEKDFPTGVICISDGEFNRSYREGSTFANFKEMLRTVFSQEYVDNFKLVLWDIPNGYYGDSTPKFEELADCPNMFHMSGYDPAGIAFMLGSEYHPQIPKTSEELFYAAMDQELLNLLKL